MSPESASRFGDPLQPQDVIPDVLTTRAGSGNLHHEEPSPPPQQVVGIAADAARPVAASDEVAEIVTDRLYWLIGVVNNEPRNIIVTGNDSTPRRQFDAAQVPLRHCGLQSGGQGLSRASRDP